MSKTNDTSRELTVDELAETELEHVAGEARFSASMSRRSWSGIRAILFFILQRADRREAAAAG